MDELVREALQEGRLTVVAGAGSRVCADCGEKAVTAGGAGRRGIWRLDRRRESGTPRRVVADKIIWLGGTVQGMPFVWIAVFSRT